MRISEYTVRTTVLGTWMIKFKFNDIIHKKHNQMHRLHNSIGNVQSHKHHSKIRKLILAGFSPHRGGVVVNTLDVSYKGQWLEAQSLSSCCFLRQDTLTHIVSLKPGV